MKIRLDIIEENKKQYRAIVQMGTMIRLLAGKKLVYTVTEEAADMKEAKEKIRQMREEARLWARKNDIKFIKNIDFSPYP